MPSAAAALAMVFAVNHAPQRSKRRQACHSMPSKSSRDILVALNAPTASTAETTVRSWPLPLARRDRPGVDLDAQAAADALGRELQVLTATPRKSSPRTPRLFGASYLGR
jgi:hypothetical protein